MKLNKKVLTGIFILILLFTVSAACFFIAEETDHECSGEDCPVCAFMEECENTLHQIGSGPLSYISTAFPFVIYMAVILTAVSEPVKETLVTYKVRMDN